MERAAFYGGVWKLLVQRMPYSRLKVNHEGGHNRLTGQHLQQPSEDLVQHTAQRLNNVVTYRYAATHLS